jgi:PKD repeat protein
VTGDGGTAYAYRQVMVYRLPIVNFTVAPSLVMLPDQEMQTFNMSEYASTYLWDFGDEKSSTDTNPRHLYTAPGIYDVSLKAWTENGCEDSLTKEKIVEVVATGELIFPTAFRPDRSGPSGGWYSLSEPANNTIFRPYWEGVVEYTLRIYNRWGELLYVSEDVMKGWDGYHDGELCKQDVYVWKVWATFTNGTKVIRAGDVTLLR